MTSGTRTIIEYAQYVLDDPRIKEFVRKFKTYQAVADRLMDSFELLVDNGVLAFKNDEELEIARSFNHGNEKTKNRELWRMIEKDLYPHDEWKKEMFGAGSFISAVALRGADKPHPNVTDMPLIMFHAFAMDKSFGSYLFKDTLSFLNGTYFSKEIDLARQRYLVFAVYLWTKTQSNQQGFFELNEWPEHTRIRSLFLNEYKSYLHLDVWHSSEYLGKNKKGSIMRLWLATPTTGSIVVQRCGERSISCNKTYSLDTQGDLMTLRGAYLRAGLVNEAQQLVKLGLSFECRHCQNETASLYSPESKEMHFYCNQECFNNCCDPGK